jgi:polyhydroxyalkanoate synthesis repressor PhaR
VGTCIIAKNIRDFRGLTALIPVLESLLLAHFCGDTKLATDAATDNRKHVQLRRYPNRRYYDSARSQHLTLEEIFRLIAEGNSVQISDSKTGEDITTRVLAQLILEQAPSKWAALPAELFHQLIRANDTLLHEFVDKYFHRALTAFERSQREFEQYMRQALGLSNSLLAMNPAPWGANWSEMMLGPFMRAFLDNNAPEKDGQPAPAAPSSNGAEPQANGAATDLKAQIDELKHEVQALRNELRHQ